ncbi:MAG TPA: 3-methylcrotonyl-CoA carboxylase, partial [Rubrivivax sp.]|nr:3-methylcrotonyl-CoA carboxylase [Rubrivivax sp.]
CPQGAEHIVELLGPSGAERRIAIDGLQADATVVFAGGRLHLALNGQTGVIDDLTHAPPLRADAAGESAVHAPMNGRLLAVLVAVGERVAKGQRVAVLEAMKMEHQLVARRDGTVERIGAVVGDQLTQRALVVKLADEAPVA